MALKTIATRLKDGLGDDNLMCQMQGYKRASLDPQLNQRNMLSHMRLFAPVTEKEWRWVGKDRLCQFQDQHGCPFLST